MANPPTVHYHRDAPSTQLDPSLGTDFERESWMSESKFPAMLLQTYLYGLYVVLFCTCVYTLVKRKVGRRDIMAATIAMFFLASAELGMTMILFIRFVLRGQQILILGSRDMDYKAILYGSINAITSGLFIHRCYALWQYKPIIILPVLLVMGGTVSSFASAARIPVADRLVAATFVCTAAANGIVTSLIAGQLLWSAWKANAIVGIKGRKMRLATSVMLESGIIYTVTILLYLLIRSLVLDVALTQVAGIAATLMIFEVIRNGGGFGMKSVVSMGRTDTLGRSAIENTNIFSRSFASMQLADIDYQLQRTQTNSTISEDLPKEME